MNIFFKYSILIFLFLSISSCKSQTGQVENTENASMEKQDSSKSEEILLVIKEEPKVKKGIIVGAAQPDLYLDKLKGKRVGVVTNATGVINISDTGVVSDTIDYSIHIVDYLLGNGVDVKKIFAPEHGFRGDADAGAHIKNGVDSKTSLPIISLYGSNKKPTSTQISDLDVLVFDIQDVGVRFYTYISTLAYVMEAAAENNKKVIVFDRPNPNGSYVDGPVLDPAFSSFVGMYKIPIVYGMTIGEYAQMVNGEAWLKNGIKADLEIIPLKNYTHNTHYSLPIKPSPNLATDKSINLYPSTCFFEGTNVSEGRGTSNPFVIFGSPYLKGMSYTFTPAPNKGASAPRYSGKLCYGENLENTPDLHEISLKWLIETQKKNTVQPFWIKNSGQFWIDKLAGTDKLRKQIDAGMSEQQIKASWQEDLEAFKKIRSKYLLYN